MIISFGRILADNIISDFFKFTIVLRGLCYSYGAERTDKKLDKYYLNTFIISLTKSKKNSDYDNLDLVNG